MKTENIKGLVELLNSDARNSMHSILGFLELVREGTLDAAQREYLEACRGAADRHFRCIEDVHAVLGMSHGEAPVLTNFAPVDLFARVAEVLGVIAARTGVRLSCSVDPEMPLTLSADLDRVAFTLLRLSEAVVSVAEGDDVRLNLRQLQSSEGLTLIFEIFMTARVLPQSLMDALQRDELDFSELSETNRILGLSAARNLAISLGGRIEASTDACTGTRVAVFLPVGLPLQRVPAAAAVATAPAPTQRALRILVAEDSTDSFQLFKAYLEGESHDLVRATNGAEAVNLATTGNFDLVFMDIRMPVLDGYAATKEIRYWETGKDRSRMPIVVLSAEDLRSQRRMGALVGCSGHLAKPLRKADLLEAIRTYTVPEPLMLDPSMLVLEDPVA